jgi:hypothetical protein
VKHIELPKSTSPTVQYTVGNFGVLPVTGGSNFLATQSAILTSVNCKQVDDVLLQILQPNFGIHC